MQVNAASENTSQVILNEDAWKSKLTTKKYSSKRWVKFRESQTEKKNLGRNLGKRGEESGCKWEHGGIVRRSAWIHGKKHKPKQVWKARRSPLPARPSPSQGPVPRVGACRYLSLCYWFINKYGSGALRASQSRLALNSSAASSVWPWKFKLCSASYLLPARRSPAEKPAGACAGGGGRRGDRSPRYSIPGSAPNPSDLEMKRGFEPGFSRPNDAPSASAAIFSFLRGVLSARGLLGNFSPTWREKKPSAPWSKWSLPTGLDKASSINLNTMVHAVSKSLLLPSTLIVPGPISSCPEMPDLPYFVRDTPFILY